MIYLVLLLLALATLYGPHLWSRYVLEKHGQPREDLPSTGEALARDLLTDRGLTHVRVEATEGGDHYDPTTQTVRLSRRHMDQKSVTALAVAAHEVGHAMQDAEGYEPFHTRSWLIRRGRWVERIGAGLMVAMPVLAIVTRSPRLGLMMLLAGLAVMGSSVVVHLVTLPVEWNASFGRALPILQSQRVLPARDLPVARQILTACALTYVASSMASLLNLWRWLALLRR